MKQEEQPPSGVAFRIRDLTDKYSGQAKEIIGMPHSMEAEMCVVLREDNRRLATELLRVTQELSDIRAQRRIENVRELELQFPRKGRRR